jgi:hypothetical protein
MTDSAIKELPRMVLSAFIIAYFGYALGWHWTAGIEQTLVNIAMIMIGYWFGSSKGSTDKAEQLAGRDESPSGKPGDPVAVKEEATP